MEELREKQTAGKREKQTIAAKRKKANIYLITAIFAVILVAAIVILTVLYTKSQAKLSEAEAQIQLHNDVNSALEKENQEKDSLIASLQDKLNDFLHVEDAKPVITGDQIEEQLKAASELVTYKYIYTRAARETSNKTWGQGWTLPFSDTSLLAMYDGEIEAGIDFSAIKIDVDEGSRVITITLPPSTVISNNIPQESIEVLEVKNSLFNEVSFDDYNDFIASQKPVAEQKAIEQGLLDNADREAQIVIRAFLNMIPGIDTYDVKFN